MCVLVASDMCVVVRVTKHLEMDIEQGITCWLALQTDFVERGVARAPLSLLPPCRLTPVF